MAEERNGLTDYGFFLAALGAVWSGIEAPGQRIAYIALPFILVLLMAPSRDGAAGRAGRLLVPFLSWSIVFGTLHTAMALKGSDPPLGWWTWDMVLFGTWEHLWILPYAFLAGLIAPWLQHPIASLGAAWVAALLIVVKGTPETFPFGQWSFGIIPLLVGIAYFAWGWRLAAVTLFGSWLILYLGRPAPDDVTILVGTGLALACLSLRLPASNLSERCARLAVWIYLAHPLMVFIGQSLRISWVELGLFSIVGTVILAQLLDTAVNASRRGNLEF